MPVPMQDAKPSPTHSSFSVAVKRAQARYQQKAVGNGSITYKPKGRVNTLVALRGMVEQCNTQLNRGLCPDEVTSVSAALNREPYKLTK